MFRLLRWEHDVDGPYTFEEYEDGKLRPKYAILSHTWDGRAYEVTFKDIQNGIAIAKGGYHKLQLCARQAQLDGLSYFWIGTCCVDLSREHDEHNKCMFEWYRNAAVCYVYFSDVLAPTIEDGTETWAKSRWFTRSWTLPELLAPKDIKFFDREWNPCGTKGTLGAAIEANTGIPKAALRGKPLTEFSVEERIAWASDRQTWLPEDKVYSLQGIVGVYLPAQYGEGESKAWARLDQLLYPEGLGLSVGTDGFAILDSSAPEPLDISAYKKPSQASKHLPSGVREEILRKFNPADEHVRPQVTGLAQQLPDKRRIAVTCENCRKEKLRCTPEDGYESCRNCIRLKIGCSFSAQSTVDQALPLEIETGSPRIRSAFFSELLSDSDVGDESEVSSVFSDKASSKSSVSAASMDDMQFVGVLEISASLLAQDELKMLFNLALNKVERQKVRSHFRGFLKQYGQNLLNEAGEVPTKVQAARFVYKLAGRIAEKICWDVLGSSPPMNLKQLDNGKRDLDAFIASWESGTHSDEAQATSESQDNTTAIAFDDESDGSDDEEAQDLKLPLDRVKDFLLGADALQTLVKSLKTWLKVDNHGADKRKVAQLTLVNLPEAVPRDQKPLVTSIEDKSRISRVQAESQLHDYGSRAASGPCVSLWDAFTHYLDSWANRVFRFEGRVFRFEDIWFFRHRPKPGHRRIQWNCSCDIPLSGDFRCEDDQQFQALRQELSKSAAPGHQSTSRTETQPSSSTARAAPDPGLMRLGTEKITSRIEAPSDATNAKPANDVVIDVSNLLPQTFTPKYFEVCVHASTYAIVHHELDITLVGSDGELFKLIWKKYHQTRGNGLRRLFLTPAGVNFVLFSIDRETKREAGIHRKPEEYPPKVEIERQRYHYISPKILMPDHVFLHHLYTARRVIDAESQRMKSLLESLTARWPANSAPHRLSQLTQIFNKLTARFANHNKLGTRTPRFMNAIMARRSTENEHPSCAWLNHLPKKLNKTVLAEIMQNIEGDGEDEPINPHLAFGWGVHIIDGPNHAVLWVFLITGILIAIVTSLLIWGFGKTLGGFAVANTILAIMAAIWAVGSAHVQAA